MGAVEPLSGESTPTLRADIDMAGLGIADGIVYLINLPITRP
jgi:hypothetical protein